MIAQVFAIVQLLLKAIGLWELFLDQLDKSELAAIETRRQAREAAAKGINDAQTEKEFDEASDRLHDNFPKP